MKISLIVGILILIVSCTKQNKNERLFAGNWELEKITTINYSNNEVVSETDTSYYGVMQLQNGPDEVEGNEAYFTGLELFPSDFGYWDVSTSKPKIITFNSFYSYNVDKISSRKMKISTYTTDNDLNLLQKITIEFKKS